MEFQRNNSSSPCSSNSNSSSSITTTTTNPNNNNKPKPTPSDDPMHSWWESVSKARSRIHSLASILPNHHHHSLSSLADSERPALSLLSSPIAYSAVSSSLSGSHSDPLCHWLYDTFLSSDPHLRLVVLSFIPLLSGLYLSRVHSSDPPSLAGFEAVLLALYAAETKSRAGKPLLVTIPDLSLPSIYHSPLRKTSNSQTQTKNPSVAVISPPLEPHVAVKSTKRASIVGVAIHSYFSQISHMPSWSKLEFCKFAAGWAGQDCPCRSQFDHVENINNTLALSNGNGDGDIEIEEVAEVMGNLQIHDPNCESPKGMAKGERIPLPWEILQPALRILGHCLFAPLNSKEVKDGASFAVRCLYARASHDLVPQAILATRSLIQLDNRTREAARVAATTSSNVNTPTKSKKPEIFLVSK